MQKFSHHREQVEETIEGLINQLRKKVGQTKDEWGIEANCYRVCFPRKTSIEDAMTRLFSLQVEDAESCKTTTSEPAS